MCRSVRLRAATALVAAFLGATLVPVSPLIADESANNMVVKGKEIAFDRQLGNCLACHQIKDGESPGNIGPPLIAMKARYPDKDKLRAQIYDATVINPRTMMPPFGAHGILTDEQVDQIVEFLYTL